MIRKILPGPSQQKSRIVKIGWRILVLAASLLLGACVGTDSGKKDDPVFFGTAGGANGGGGGTSGVSFHW